MTFLLLLGAGFSRNWGGFLADELFAHLLGHPAVQSNTHLKEEMWRQKNDGHDFEVILDHFRRKQTEQPQDATYGPALAAFEQAIADTFRSMNAVFLHENRVTIAICLWLTQFDAIFTLNQDLLLESSYLSRQIELLAPKRWPGGADLPGMVPKPGQPAAIPPAPQLHWSARQLVQEEDMKCEPGCQPYFKLHGSSNWSDMAGGSKLIMGSDKSGQIGADNLFRAYFGEFQSFLARRPCRLMVIGYSFRDDHVNKVIEAAAKGDGVEMFVIDPKGVDVTRGKYPVVPGAIGGGVNSKEIPFQQQIIGASSRPFSDSIGGQDAVEAQNINRFFSI